MKLSSGCAQYRLPMVTPAATASRNVSWLLISDGGAMRGAAIPPR
ncbi:hypothetical protein ACLQ28_13405 [Micromonospora sp. DT201]